ncbi:MAG: hypothetical protein CVV63_02270, partial [Tenericutes bacterium HGW-Tenericutes-8]
AFVYGALPTDFEQGDVINVEGFVAQYFNALQIAGTPTEPIYVVPSTATATEVAYPVMTIEQVNAMPLPSASAMFNMMPITVTARVMVTGTGNYDVFLVPVDHEGALVKSQAIMIYYKSNIGAIRALAGQKIEIELVLITYRTNDTVWTADFLQTADDITVIPLTDAEWIDVAKESLATTFKNEYVLDKTFTLPTEIEGVAITWASDNVLFDVATGELTMPATGQETITVTASLSKGDATGEYTATFVVGDKPVQTIAAALEVALGDLVHVQGVVTSSQYYRTFFIQDATGGIAVYTSDADLITFLTTNYGQEVALIGTRAAYNGLDQISSTQIYTQVGEATMPTAVNIDSFGLDAEALAMYQGQLVELTGLAVTAVVTDNFGNVTITLYDANSNNSVTLKWDSRVTLSTEAAALLATIAVDDVIDVVTPLAWSNGPFLYFTDSTDVTEQVLTDAQRIALAKAVVESYFDAEYNEETTLSLGTSLFGATVVYDTASTYFDVATGDVTLPTIGRETVTVTATITLGTESDTATIEFVVGVINISTLPTTADATIVTVQGIVTSGEYNNTFFIQDASGAVAIYTSNADFTLALVVGNLVEVTGELDFYSGLVEVKPSSITVLATAQTLPTPMNVDTADLDDLVLIDYQSQVVIMTNMVVQSISTGSNNYSVFLYNAVADDSIELRYDVRFVISAPVLAVLQGLVVGDIVDVTSVLSWYNGAQLVYTETSIVVDTAVPSAAALAAVDTIKAESDAAELSVVDTVTEATTLVLPAAGTFLSTIVWTSSDDLVIDPTTGVVTLPAVGTVDVTLTATVTLNAAEVVVTFDVTVGVPEVVVEPTPFRDLIISEYVEPSTGNSKAIELYNVYFTTVDL